MQPSDTASKTDGSATPQPDQQATNESADLQQILQRLRDEIDNLNLDLAVEKTRNWAREHPVLAVAAALGVGLMTASIIAALMEDSRPQPTLTDKVRNQVVTAGENVRNQAAELNQALGKQAEVLSERLASGIEPLMNGNGLPIDADLKGSVTATILDTVKAAAAAAAVQKMSDWFKKFSR